MLSKKELIYSNISITRVRKFRERLTKWYPEHKRSFPWRKSSATTYEKIISEVLLQRTNAEVVATFFPIFVKEYPSWRRLSESPEEKLQNFLKPLGLWRRRTIVIKALSKEIVRRNSRFPRTLDEIEQLPGVGQYIGNAIMIFCHGKNYPLLDTNMARVLERYFGSRILADIRYDPYLQNLAYQVVQDTDPRLINWAILDLAAKICKISNPLCSLCPTNNGCQYLGH